MNSPVNRLPPLRVADAGAIRMLPVRAPGRSLGAEPASFLIVLDFLILSAAFGLAYVLAPVLKKILLNATELRGWIALLSPTVGGEFRALADVAWALPVMAAVTLLCIQQVGGYRPLVSQSRTRLILTSAVAPLVGLGTLALLLFALRSDNWSRLFIFLFITLTMAGLCSYRLVLRWYRSHRIASGFYARNVMLVGPTSALGWLSAHVANNTARSEYDVVGYLSVASTQQPVKYETAAGPTVLPCLGDVSDLSNLLVHRPVHEVIAVNGSANEWLREVVETCDYFRITLRIVPEALVHGQLRDLELLYHSDELRLPEIVLRPRHLDSTALFLKRLIDIIGSFALLVLLSPVFALVALAIKLTTPRLTIFYRWQVVGQNGRRFTGYKFSTMAVDADERKSELMAQNQMQGPVFKIRDDPRVTPLGRYLRMFSINELPQLWSVLKGDMSLVGPRPAFPHELERYELWHKRKLTVQPVSPVSGR